MNDSRDHEDELAQLREENQRLTDDLTRLEREHHRLRCEYRRVCDELDWRDEKIRGLYRVIDSLGRQVAHVTATAHQLL